MRTAAATQRQVAAHLDFEQGCAGAIIEFQAAAIAERCRPAGIATYRRPQAQTGLRRQVQSRVAGHIQPADTVGGKGSFEAQIAADAADHDAAGHAAQHSVIADRATLDAAGNIGQTQVVGDGAKLQVTGQRLNRSVAPDRAELQAGSGVDPQVAPDRADRNSRFKRVFDPAIAADGTDFQSLTNIARREIAVDPSDAGLVAFEQFHIAGNVFNLDFGDGADRQVAAAAPGKAQPLSLTQHHIATDRFDVDRTAYTINGEVAAQLAQLQAAQISHMAIAGNMRNDQGTAVG